MQDAGRAEQRADKALSSRSISAAARRRRAWMVLVQGCCQRVLLEEAPQTRSDVPITNYSVYPNIPSLARTQCAQAHHST